MKKPSDIVDELRVGLDMSDQHATQIIYEKWLKLDEWKAREVAIPLIVGCAPEQWQAYLEQHKLYANEELIWHVVANDLGKGQEDAIGVAAINEWARTQTVTLHPSFLRIYEFVRKVMVSTMQSDATAKGMGVQSGHEDKSDFARIKEYEIVLGAALSLLSKMPDKCRDANGFADGEKITALIEQTAVKWFPTSEPVLNRNEMIALIDKWLE